MGWVTLSCRTKEDKVTASYYQLRLLQVSRAQRQRARYYGMLGTQLQNDQRVELAAITENYNSQKDDKQNFISFARSVIATRQKEDSGIDLTDAEQDLLDSADSNQEIAGLTIEQIEALIEQAETEVNDLTEQKEFDINDKKLYYDQEMELNEQMASDEDAVFEEEQNDLEVQLEAVSTERDAVKDSASQAISNSVIKLS